MCREGTAQMAVPYENEIAFSCLHELRVYSTTERAYYY